MKKFLNACMLLFLIVGCSPESDNNTVSDTNGTGNNDDNTNPPDEVTLRLWKEEFESMVDPDADINSEYIYNASGYCERIQGSDGEVIRSFEYDSNGRMIAMNNGDSGEAVSFAYDGNKIISSTYASFENSKEFEYDSQGRLVEWSEFDQNGQLVCTIGYEYSTGLLPTVRHEYCYATEYVYVWDTKNNHYYTAYPEPYRLIKSFFPNNWTSNTFNNGSGEIIKDITYNSEDYPIEIKFFVNGTHHYTKRFQYQEID